MKDSILKTKLYKPQLPADFVERKGLLDQCNKNRNLPLSLISASAGYGKSTLVSSWINSIDTPSGWISLSSDENDLKSFLLYFISAVNNLFPKIGSTSFPLLEATEFPPVNVLYQNVINELAQTDQSFVIVLDDYHLIDNNEIHEFIIELMENPIPQLHLVLISRYDPPLPLHRYRAKGKMNEIRAKQLSFSKAESNSFIQKSFKKTPNLDLSNLLFQKSEGWITALRLLVMSNTNSKSLENLNSINLHDPFTLDYLNVEVLSGMPEDVREYVLKTSILNEFCSDLCNHIFLDDAEKDMGSEAIEWLLKKGLFIIQLDHNDNWFRFHHLFRDLLQSRLRQEYDEQSIRHLHLEAGKWLAEHNQLENAFYHLQQANEEALQIALFKKHRYFLLNEMRWGLLEKLMHQINQNEVDKDPELLLAKGWLYIYHGKVDELFKLISEYDLVLSVKKLNSDMLTGELNSLLSYKYYNGEVNFEKCIEHAEIVLHKLDSDSGYIRGFAWLFFGGSYVALGKNKEGQEIIYKALGENNRSNTEQLYMMMILNYMDWFSGDLQSLQLSTSHFFKISNDLNDPVNQSVALVFKAHGQYVKNEIESTLNTLEDAYKNRYLTLGTHHLAISSTSILAHMTIGQFNKALDQLDALYEYGRSTGNTNALQIHQALTAELNFRKGDFVSAMQWAVSLNEHPQVITITDFYYHNFTLIKIWIYQGSQQNLAKAKSLLGKTKAYFEKFNYTPHLTENYALEALVEYEAGNQDLAMEKLKYSVCYAESSGFIRIHLDLGDKMKHLLKILSMEDFAKAFVQKLLDEFHNEELNKIRITVSQDSPIVHLTDREIEILDLLAQHKSNKQIAQDLFIAYETVKRHSKNIYRKLSVGHRNEAVEMAMQLGLIQKHKVTSPLRGDRT